MSKHQTNLAGQHRSISFLGRDRAPDDSVSSISLMSRVSDAVKTIPQPVTIAKGIILERNEIMRINDNASRVLSSSHNLCKRFFICTH